MAHSARTLRLVAASVIALLMMGGTYALTGSNPLFGEGSIAIAQSSEELLREYAAKDSDGDALPDWQEALYGTDPANPESFQAGITDGEAVAQGLVTPKVSVRPEGEPTDPSQIPGITAAPASLTDRFSQALLKQYLSNRGENPPSQEEIAAFVRDAVANLAAESESSPAFTLADVKTGGSSLRTYVIEAEAIFVRETVSAEKNELSHFADALKDETSALPKIREISAAYENMARALIALPVPPEARQAHLAIANGLMRMSEVTADMATLKTDPVRALMGIALYERAALSLAAGFENLSAIFDARGLLIGEGEAGYQFYRTAERAADVRGE